MNKDDDNFIINQAFLRHLDVAKKSHTGITDDVLKAAEVIFAAMSNGNKMLLCGNGGSAADCEDFAGEWLGRYRGDRRPFPAMALSTHTSTITAVGNDYSFDQIFSRQTEALGQKGDILAAFTTSGQSKNVLEALEVAKRKGMKTVVFTGAKGEALKTMADVAIVVPSTETARIQEIHRLCFHSICEYIDGKHGLLYNDPPVRLS
ncbi:MAG: SIS domain-containing protein [Candidatus Liptonbacteria bacterium]|nr:SIS domain-containing protein [Candidatus Liptonbacteria bacterium]